MKIENLKFKIILILIISIGAFFRFYKLDWGEGLFTHPDEYHIVASANQLSFPNQMHPHFFSYGTLTIYLIYFTKAFVSIVNDQWSMINIFLLGRFYSALFSTVTIYLVYKLTLFFTFRRYALLAAFFVAITPGLIQQAHFATPESILIFFLLGSLFFLLYFLQYKKIRFLIFTSVFFGLALGVKISALVFLLPIGIGILFQSQKNPLRFIVFIITTLITLFIVAPFIFLDFPAFWRNLHYESSLAVGTIPVFYTRQFIQTTPIIFQLEKIFPFALGLPLLITGIGGFFFSLLRLTDKKYFLLMIAFLALFVPNAFLFAKWTRFIAPTFPFFSLFAVFFLFHITEKNKTVGKIFTIIIFVTTIVWTYSFFSIYRNTDVRITASNWLVSYIPNASTILVEGGNTIDLPLSGNYQKISLNFYDIEDNPIERQKIIDGLDKADYFLVQSRRVFLNHQRSRKYFPKTARFYDMLFTKELGFTQIKEFHSFPSLEIGNWKLEIPDEVGEETWSVFDHPVIRVFKKNKAISPEAYAKIFEN